MAVIVLRIPKSFKWLAIGVKAEPPAGRAWIDGVAEEAAKLGPGFDRQ